jgi:glycosyltransferase involved in cell wall biosynthesis
MRRAGAVITVSRKAALEIEGYIKKPVLVVHNIIDTARFSIQPYAQGVIHIGFLGRLSSEQHVKGLDVLLKAISKIRKEFVLDIAGDGHLMAEYQSTAVQLGIAEKCRFHGFIGYDDVPGFMSRLHFFVNTSRFESFGIAIVEAMASGLPVVSFDNGGPADFVNSSNGILVENQNEEKLVQALDAMISNYSSYKRERIREGVMMKFSRDKFTSAMEDIYSSAVKQFLIRQLP